MKNISRDDEYVIDISRDDEYVIDISRDDEYVIDISRDDGYVILIDLLWIQVRHSSCNFQKDILSIKWKTKKYHTVGTVLQANRSIVQRGKLDAPNMNT